MLKLVLCSKSLAVISVTVVYVGALLLMCQHFRTKLIAQLMPWAWPVPFFVSVQKSLSLNSVSTLHQAPSFLEVISHFAYAQTPCI